MSAIGQRVQDARKAKGWTRERLDEEAGLTRGHVSLIERGERARLEAETAAKLAGALGVSVSWLISGPEDENVTHRKRASRGNAQPGVARSVHNTRTVRRRAS